MRRRVLAVVAAVGSVVAACGSRDAASPGSPQEVPHNPTEWQIEYHVTGGLAGRDEYV